MHSRRLACLLLGMWLAGSILMTWVVNDGADSVDRLLAEHSAAASLRLRALPSEDARLLLQYEAAEANRSRRETWESVEVVLGGVFFFYLLFGTLEGKVALALALAMVAVALAQRFIMTPELVSVARLADFIPPGAPSHERKLLPILAGFDTGAEILKCLAGVALAGILLWQRQRHSGDAGQQVNLVDKANYGHINR